MPVLPELTDVFEYPRVKASAPGMLSFVALNISGKSGATVYTMAYCSPDACPTTKYLPFDCQQDDHPFPTGAKVGVESLVNGVVSVLYIVTKGDPEWGTIKIFPSGLKEHFRASPAGSDAGSANFVKGVVVVS